MYDAQRRSHPCVGCGGNVKTQGRERCIACANRLMATRKRAAWSMCRACGEQQVQSRRHVMCKPCSKICAGRASTPEAETDRIAKIKASGIGRYERTPETRAKMRMAKLGTRVLSTQGENHWKWGGGRNAAGYGYMRVLVGPGEYRKEHTFIIEKELGRPLTKGEEVHHVNGIRSDNSRANLAHCRTRHEHRLMHGSLQRAAYLAVQSGLITFANGEYEFVGPHGAGATKHCPMCTCCDVGIEP